MLLGEILRYERGYFIREDGRSVEIHPFLTLLVFQAIQG